MHRLLLFSAMISFISFILWNCEIVLLVWSDKSMISLVRSSANTVDVTVFVFFCTEVCSSYMALIRAFLFLAIVQVTDWLFYLSCFSPQSCSMVSVYLITSSVSIYKDESRLQRASIFNWGLKHDIHKQVPQS